MVFYFDDSNSWFCLKKQPKGSININKNRWNMHVYISYRSFRPCFLVLYEIVFKIVLTFLFLRGSFRTLLTLLVLLYISWLLVKHGQEHFYGRQVQLVGSPCIKNHALLLQKKCYSKCWDILIVEQVFWGLPSPKFLPIDIIIKPFSLHFGLSVPVKM